MSTPKHASRDRRPARATRAPVRRRLSPADRRRDLLRVAGELVTTRGVDGVQLAEVAAGAGVTRPVVYKFFPNRQALILAMLEDYAGELTGRLGRGAVRRVSGGPAEVTRAFVEAACDTIETRGAGPWYLLDSKGPDPEVARLGQEIMDRLMTPWRTRIARVTGLSEREAASLARMIVASVRAVLEMWCAGLLTRDQTVRDATRGVSALFAGFADTRAPRARRTPRA